MRYRDGLSQYRVWRFYSQPFCFYHANKHADADNRLTHASAVGVSKNVCKVLQNLQLALMSVASERRKEGAVIPAHPPSTPNFTTVAARLHPCLDQLRQPQTGLFNPFDPLLKYLRTPRPQPPPLHTASIIPMTTTTHLFLCPSVCLSLCVCFCIRHVKQYLHQIHVARIQVVSTCK